MGRQRGEEEEGRGEEERGGKSFIEKESKEGKCLLL